MSTKESSGSKKEKSLSGTKAKYSPNLAASEKKEVKLRRKESEKVKQSSDSSRMSVLGRFFHNLVDSDDSRKKSALSDSKKKRMSRDLDGPGVDLDLPEHGIVLRKTQTLQKDLAPHPNLRARAMTLANQSRENRNRWSSYDIHDSNFVDGALPPTTLQMDSSTLVHKSQSVETLNANLTTDPAGLSKNNDNFEIINHSDSVKQPEAIRKHAVLLQSIQNANVNRATRSEKMTELQGAQGSNGWLMLTGEMVCSGQKKGTDVMGNIPDQKDNHLQKTSSNSKLVSADDGKDLQPHNSRHASSDTLALLNEKSMQINKALTNKRKVLAQLFDIAEEDFSHLLEKDTELSKDVSVRKMILISLLQSDHLMSVINGMLVPCENGCADGSVDKEASSVKGDEYLVERPPHHSQTLHDAAVQLHGYLTLLKQMIIRDVDENNRLKKSLEEAQQRLLLANTTIEIEETKKDGVEVFQCGHGVVYPGTCIRDYSETHGDDTKRINDTFEHHVEDILLDLTEVEKVEEEGKILSLDKVEDIKQQRLLSTDAENETEEHPLGNVSADNLNTTADVTDNVNIATVHQNVNTSAAADADASQQDQISFSSSVETSVVHNSDTCNLNVAMEEKEKCQTVFCGLDDLKKIAEVEEIATVCHPDSSRKFTNLESIPEDDDRYSWCDAEQKISVDEEDLIQIVLKGNFLDDKMHSNVRDITSNTEDDDTLSNTEAKTHSKIDFDIQSDLENTAEGDKANAEMTDRPDLQNAADTAICNVESDVPPSIENDAQSAVQNIEDNAGSNAGDDFHLELNDNARSNQDNYAQSNRDAAASHVDEAESNTDNVIKKNVDIANSNIDVKTPSAVECGNQSDVDNAHSSAIKNGDRCCDGTLCFCNVLNDKFVESDCKNETQSYPDLEFISTVKTRQQFKTDILELEQAETTENEMINSSELQFGENSEAAVESRWLSHNSYSTKSEVDDISESQEKASSELNVKATTEILLEPGVQCESSLEVESDLNFEVETNLLSESENKLQLEEAELEDPDPQLATENISLALTILDPYCLAVQKLSSDVIPGKLEPEVTRELNKANVAGDIADGPRKTQGFENSEKYSQGNSDDELLGVGLLFDEYNV